MPHRKLMTEVELTAYFFDVDPMKFVWHGNYAKYLEVARCALLDIIGYNYHQMEESGYVWPIVSLRSKYIRPLIYNQKFIVKASLLEYEHRIKIGYIITDAKTGGKIHKAESVQMAVDMKTMESCLVSPPCLYAAVQQVLKEKGWI